MFIRAGQKKGLGPAHPVIAGDDVGNDGGVRMAQMRPGDRLHLFGPLGNGFQLPREHGFVLLVAGGIGIAPLPFLTEALVRSSHSSARVLWFGGKSNADLVCVDHFLELGFTVELVTEDGSAGRRGLVTDHLEQWLLSQKEPPKLMYSCGHYSMQRRVAQLASGLGIPCQLSMEALMACGVGACLGCSLKCWAPLGSTTPYYANVCQQGPVFSGEEIVWD